MMELTGRWRLGAAVDCAFVEVDDQRDTLVIRQVRSMDPGTDPDAVGLHAEARSRVQFHLCDSEGRWVGMPVEIERDLRGPVDWAVEAREVLARARVETPFTGALYAVHVGEAPPGRSSGLMVAYHGPGKFGYYLGGISLTGSYRPFNEIRGTAGRRFLMIAPKVWLREGSRTRIVFINASTDPDYKLAPTLRLELLPPTGASGMHAEIGPVPPFAAAVADVDSVFGPKARDLLAPYDGCGTAIATSSDPAVFVTFTMTEGIDSPGLLVDHTRPLRSAVRYAAYANSEPTPRELARESLRNLLTRMGLLQVARHTLQVAKKIRQFRLRHSGRLG